MSSELGNLLFTMKFSLRQIIKGRLINIVNQLPVQPFAILNTSSDLPWVRGSKDFIQSLGYCER